MPAARSAVLYAPSANIATSSLARRNENNRIVESLSSQTARLPLDGKAATNFKGMV